MSRGEYFKMWGYFQFPLVLTSVKDPVVKVSLSLSGSYGDGSNAVNTGVPSLDTRLPSGAVRKFLRGKKCYFQANLWWSKFGYQVTIRSCTQIFKGEKMSF